MKRTDLTAHGFRSTFSDWAAERTADPRETVEMALAHAIENKVEAAYRRGAALAAAGYLPTAPTPPHGTRPVSRLPGEPINRSSRRSQLRQRGPVGTSTASSREEIRALNLKGLTQPTVAFNLPLAVARALAASGCVP